MKRFKRIGSIEAKYLRIEDKELNNKILRLFQNVFSWMSAREGRFENSNKPYDYWYYVTMIVRCDGKFVMNA